MNDRAAYVALALTPGIGSARLQNLLASCGSATGALTAPAAFLGTVPGISAAAVTAIKQRRITDGEQVLAAAEKAGITVLTPADAEFPASFGKFRSRRS
jgi:predicted Rossmann fold nucleotide-binding protein DprA/Smf involved in DNA uptake